VEIIIDGKPAPKSVVVDVAKSALGRL